MALLVERLAAFSIGTIASALLRYPERRQWSGGFVPMLGSFEGSLVASQIKLFGFTLD
jgi:hypothetical protein